MSAFLASHSCPVARPVAMTSDAQNPRFSAALAATRDKTPPVTWWIIYSLAEATS